MFLLSMKLFISVSVLPFIIRFPFLFQLSDWIKEKYQTATDESYRDLVNLLPKLQKHQAFESELKANLIRLDEVNGVS